MKTVYYLIKAHRARWALLLLYDLPTPRDDVETVCKVFTGDGWATDAKRHIYQVLKEEVNVQPLPQERIEQWGFDPRVLLEAMNRGRNEH